MEFILTYLTLVKEILNPILTFIIYVLPFWTAVYIIGLSILEKANGKR